MINTSLALVAAAVNTELKSKFKTSGDVTLVSGLTENDGSRNLKTENKLVFTLVNTRFDHQRNKVPAKPGQHTPNPQTLNLSVVVSACFSDYDESLKFLSATIAYLNENAIITPENDKGIEKLTIELQNLSYEETHDIWKILGNQYTPSAVYKIRIITGE